MSDIEKEQRRWELTCGKELVTVNLSSQKRVYIKNHNLKYIFETLGFSQYMSLCSVSAYNKNDVPSGFSEDEIHKLNEQMVFNTAIFLKEFVLCDNIQYNPQDNEYRIGNNNEFIALNKEDMNEIFSAFREIYSLSGEKVAFADAKPKTKEHEEFLAVIRKAQANIDRKKNGERTIDGIIMGVTSKHPSYNLTNIWDLTMWQLMETYTTLHKIDNAYFTKIGIYTGNIDMKKSKITNKELDWSVRD